MNDTVNIEKSKKLLVNCRRSDKGLIIRRLLSLIVVFIVVFGLIAIPVMAETYEINVPAVGETGYGNYGEAIGQSFTANGTGMLTELNVISFGGSHVNTTITIYEGEGLIGDVLGIVTGVTTHEATSWSDYSVIDLTSANVSVTNGNVYTFYLTNTNGWGLYDTGSNNYDGGIAIYEGVGHPEVDFVFSLNIVFTPADVEITAFDAIANVNAGTVGSATYGNATEVIAALPTSATANTSAVTVPVTTWVDTDGYNSAVAGNYTFTATLGAIPSGYANAGGYTATVEVVVVAPADVEITAFDAIANVNAGTVGSATYGNATEVIAALPTSATANTSAVTVPVTTWVDTDGYNPAVAGSYTFTATLGAIPAGYANAGGHTTTVEVVVAALADVEITAFDAIANVNAGTVGSATYGNATEVIAALPTSATANTSAVTVPVTTWVDTDGYNPAVAGNYTFTATLGAIPAGYANAGGHTTTVEVVVAALADVEITAFDAIANVNAGTAGSATYGNATEVIAALPTSATANTSAVTVPVTTWVDTDGYNPAVAGSYTFTATLGAIPAGYANVGGYTATVEVVVAAPADVEITAFDAIANVNAGTVGSAIYGNATEVIAALPTSATANTSAVTVPVTTWVDTDGYNPAVAGNYTFTATLGAIPAGYANAGGYTATVEVVITGIVASNDATLKISSIVKGQAVTNLGTPNATLGSETAGAVTITAAKAGDTSNAGSFITLFDKNYTNATVKVVKYASGASTANFGTDTAYVNEYIKDGDFFIIKVTAEDTTVNYYRINVSVTPAPSSGGSSHSNTTTQPNQGTVIVIVNGKGHNAGTETKTTENRKSTVTVKVDNKAIESKIDETVKNPTGTNNVVQVLVADTKSEVTRVELTGDIVKRLEQKTFDVAVKRDNIEYVIPAEEFTISKVAQNFGLQEKDLKDIKVEVEITELDEKVVAKYNEAAKANGAELVFPPVAFEVVAKTIKADGKTGTVEISKFNNYVERVMEIPAGVDASKITTGIVFNLDGTYSHVPTEVFKKDGKWYAKLNSLTNSNYSVVWNSVTVNSVENHWAQNAVNDMASRLVVFNSESFDPNKAITRADFAEYIVRALGVYRVGFSYENKFKDVSESSDRTLAVLIASEYGIVTGYTDGTFKPDALITREEAMAMYQRAMKITKLEGNDINRYQSYTDFAKVSGWASTSVKDVLAAHVFNGISATTILPKSNLTHAEAVQAIKNLLVESKLINK